MIYKFRRKQYLRSLESGDIYVITKRFFSKTKFVYYYTVYNVTKKRFKSIPVVEAHKRYKKDKVAKLLYGKI